MTKEHFQKKKNNQQINGIHPHKEGLLRAAGARSRVPRPGAAAPAWGARAGAGRGEAAAGAVSGR